jgi:Protein of unknown function (DUF2878)
MKMLFNVIFFQLLWLVSVGGAGKGYWWVGLPVMAAFAIYHFSTTQWKRADAYLLLISVALGALVDSAMIWSGLLRFEQPLPFAQFAPIWITLLWAGFALTLNHSMRYFQNKTWPSILFGLFGGPLAYYVANHVWNAVHFESASWIVYTVLGLVWAIMTPLLLQIGFNLRIRFHPE